MSALLRLHGMHAWYGKSHVLQGVDMHVGAGEVVTVLGRNGSGRSTLLKSVMGLVRREGSVLFKGREIARLRTCEIAALGVGYVPESRDIFPGLTVEQNLLLGEQPRRRPSRWRLDDMYALFPRLRERRHTPGGVLSGGEQQMLTLCRTLMGDPDIVMVDEPTEGLAPKVVQEVADCLRVLQARGIAVLLVEQKLAIALEVSQRLYVMGHGMLMFEGTPRELQASPAIRKEWLEV